SCAYYANLIFNNSEQYTGFTLILGAILFSFQIYGDFSGYSDIAIGTSRLFGFSLMKNFSFPYFSRNIAEFWRRWHISLSTWFRDYVYIPLGGSRVKRSLVIRNTFIIFLVSGLWHGANWTFLAWGFLHALYFIPLSLLGQNKKNNEIVAKGKVLPTFRDVFAIFLTFSLTVFSWIFFRASSISHAFEFISGILNTPFINFPNFFYDKEFFLTLIALLFFILIEWLGRENEYAIEFFHIKFNKIQRYSFYYLLIFLMFLLKGQQQDFIYFQF
ncbi:MAG: MBOAT family protein, partial [Sphaerochaetaceae bacterium]|nr:MBOAT family protein [Sphaerochaetaceae bacterium]